MSIYFDLTILGPGLDRGLFWSSFEPLDEDTFQTLQQALLSYIQSEYIFGPAESEASCEWHFACVIYAAP